MTTNVEKKESVIMEDLKFDDPRKSATTDQEAPSGLFHHMAIMPWPYMTLLPIVFILLIVFGWMQDDIIEDEVNNIWVKRSGSYYNDVQYAQSLGKDGLDASAFIAMSIERNGENLFTEKRLEIIRARMEAAESTVVSDKNGNNFTWPDFCFSTGGFNYEFPCVRLTPMDFYQEANWFFDHPEALYRRTYYHKLIGDQLIDPRIPRFGALTQDCAEQCSDLLVYRTDPTSPGYSPLSLFADVGTLEYSDECKICIETAYETTVSTLARLIPASFGILALELQRYAETTTTNMTTEKRTQVGELARKAAIIANTTTANDARDFYKYYVTRGVYAELGAPAYYEGYQQLGVALADCYKFSALLGLTCPPQNITLDDAKKYLLAHADAEFSSVTTGGSPLPLWSEEDGTGVLLRGDKPVGGSGIDMSGDIRGMAFYLDVLNYENQTAWSPAYTREGFADPDSFVWALTMATNPIYAWFMAGVTDAGPDQKCGNGDLTGTDSGLAQQDNATASLAASISSDWCNKYTVPNDNTTDNNSESYTVQYFARMWYDLLISSDSFLRIEEGVHDPYLWTTGNGCGYSVRGSRATYTGQNESIIMEAANGHLYSIDEGVSLGVIQPELFIGGVKYNDSERTEISVIQTLYASLKPRDIVERVKSCKRPGGGLNITEDEAKDLLLDWKEQMENAWTEGWQDDDQEVQFVGLFDDSGGVGTTGRMLEEITLDNNTLTAISIVLIAIFSAAFLFSVNPIESRVLVALVGVALVVLGYFAAVGFGILTGIKVSVSIAWTLPFIILGLGVDDMYIVLESIKERRGYTEGHYLDAMKEVIVPVTMTSIVNASMFAILNISDIPAIYLTARVAVYAVLFLYFVVVFCFPAYCYLDMRRQATGKCDVFFCVKASDKSIAEAGKSEDFRALVLYDKFYEPLMLGRPSVRLLTHGFVWITAAVLIGLGAYGITQREVGLGLEDFFPSSNQASVWATKRTEELSSWTIGIRWGELENLDTDPTVPLKLIKQFEGVVGTSKVADMDTKNLWMANFLIWSSNYCDKNFARDDFSVRECGHDKGCKAVWVPNDFDLRAKTITGFNDPTCRTSEGGICRAAKHLTDEDRAMFTNNTTDEDEVFCPTIKGWDVPQWKSCLREWRIATGASGTNFLFEEERGTPKECPGEYNTDQNFTWPIPHSGGPSMFALDLYSHQDTLDMIVETRKYCDDDEALRCWLTGIPYDYWSQYEGIFAELVILSAASIATGFLIAFLFLFAKFSHEKLHPRRKVIAGSAIGAGIIALTIVMSLVSVVGLSILAGVSLTGFSNMSFVLSVGFAVEYSVHIVSRWLRADLDVRGIDRVKHTMSSLMLPTFMSFVSSLIGVTCLAFTEFEFNKIFFFRPLIIVLAVTYFFGVWWLPAALTLCDADIVKLGKHPSEREQVMEEDFNESASSICA